MFAISDVEGAQLKIRQIYFVLHLVPPHQKVAGLDVSVQNVAFV